MRTPLTEGQRAYQKKLRDKRWKAKRLQILERDGHKCVECEAVSGLAVHHRQYVPGAEPWESPNDDLVTWCKKCHYRHHMSEKNREHNAMAHLNVQGGSYRKGIAQKMRAAGISASLLEPFIHGMSNVDAVKMWRVVTGFPKDDAPIWQSVKVFEEEIALRVPPVTHPIPLPRPQNQDPVMSQLAAIRFRLSVIEERIHRQDTPAVTRHWAQEKKA